MLIKRFNVPPAPVVQQGSWQVLQSKAAQVRELLKITRPFDERYVQNFGTPREQLYAGRAGLSQDEYAERLEARAVQHPVGQVLKVKNAAWAPTSGFNVVLGYQTRFVDLRYDCMSAEAKPKDLLIIYYNFNGVPSLYPRFESGDSLEPLNDDEITLFNETLKGDNGVHLEEYLNQARQLINFYFLSQEYGFQEAISRCTAAGK